MSAFEVKIIVAHEALRIPVTIATFEEVAGSAVSSRRYIPQPARQQAITFARQIDEGFAVDVVDTAQENVSPKFGLVYHRDAEV